LFVVSKSTDAVFIQTVLILELKTSFPSKTQSLWPLLDFRGGWWGFVGLLFCGGFFATVNLPGFLVHLRKTRD